MQARALPAAIAFGRGSGGGCFTWNDRAIGEVAQAGRSDAGEDEGWRTRVAVAGLDGLRERIVPMLRVAAEEYRHRTPPGYPVVLDDPAADAVGIEIDSSFALYVVEDAEGLHADLYYRSSRNDNRSSASREKYAGTPVNDRRPLPDDVSDQHLRNLLAELMSRWNQQPGVIHITDS